MKTVYDALRNIRERAETEHDKGMRFEAACRYFLRNDPLWRNKFTDVWAWDNSPLCTGHDYGIDIVARDADDGTLWAIQCKCYDDGATLTEKELGTFYSAAHHKDYPHTMIMSTISRYSPNLDKVAKQHDTVRVDIARMDEAGLDWEPFIYNRPAAGTRQIFEPRPHQVKAIEDVCRFFDMGIARGKLIMACGTGKTLTALRIAEKFLGRGGKNGRGSFVLFLAPSISLVSQSLRAWASQAVNPLKAEVVCSDKTSSRSNEDAWENSLADIPYPADTDPEALARHIAAKKNPDGLTVIFSTYQSLEVIYDAQRLHQMPDFDLIICDEAHRTTGASFAGKRTADESAFIRIHDKNYVRGKFRLYMTATPKIYGDKVKKKAQIDDYVLSSMDDTDTFGPELHKLTFGEAIDQKLLTDYKPIALTVSADAISPDIQREFAGPEGLEIDEPARIIGCWKGLARPGLARRANLAGNAGSPGEASSAHPTRDAHLANNAGAEGKGSDAACAGNNSTHSAIFPADETGLCPSRAAVAFCNTIAESKRMAQYFVQVVERYAETERALGHEVPELACKAKHVDGSMNSAERRELLDWLASREETPDGKPVCHILFNARCLAEGVDVPSLDAVLFLRPKKSQIDVIQAVGRVMRRSPGKEYGYIILPLVIPSGLDASDALDKSDDFAIIWGVAKALRSHDERMEAVINALQYDDNAKPPIDIEPVFPQEGGPNGVEEAEAPYDAANEQLELDLDAQALRRAVNAMLVKKCGTKVYWQDWAKDIGAIAKVYVERINARVTAATPDAPEGEARAEFLTFLRGLRDSLNEGITENEAIEMLAQHAITLPIFEALFGGKQNSGSGAGGEDFAKLNPVSEAMEKMLATLRKFRLSSQDEERELDSLYSSVRMRCQQVTTDAGRQKLIKELYENFFQQAFKRTSEKMGIVYTPTEVVDYILHAANRLMIREFGKALADEDVHILDPFTGTGTFIQRLIASPDLIPDSKLPHKYAHELHATEIMLMAYYIASINIEHAYHARVKGQYLPFPGAVLADTFQMSEEGNPLDFGAFEKNTRRAVEQYQLPVRVIIGNPPYSAGQKNANDNNANESYPTLDARIAATYAAGSTATNKNALYDSYIRAFRWAADRIGEKGVIAFVTNAGWLRGGATAGFRKCLAEEFNSIYVFNLRGNARTSGELRRKEKDNVFGQGTRTPVCITMLVKNPASSEHGVIRYCDIGDYLTREEKLGIVRHDMERDPLEDPSTVPAWQEITPDAHGDWLDQRDDSWNDYLPLGIEKFKEPSGIFTVWSSGIETGRDEWTWSFSCADLANNIRKHIDFYNAERLRYVEDSINEEPKKFVKYDQTACKWNRSLFQRFVRNEEIVFSPSYIVKGQYRPFCKQYAYYHDQLITVIFQMPRFFPPASDISLASKASAAGNAKTNKVSPPPCSINTIYSNLIISMVAPNANKPFSCIMTDILPDLELEGHGQCFPLYYYPKASASSAPSATADLFTDDTTSGPCAELASHLAATSPADGSPYGAAGEKGLCPENGRPQPVYAITEKTVAAFRTVYPDAFAGAYQTAAKRTKDLGRFSRRPVDSCAGDSSGNSQTSPADERAIGPEDIFFYIYGVLHHPHYREKFADNLTKEMPRIPFLKGFALYSYIGRALARLHVDYETGPMYALTEEYAGNAAELSANPGLLTKLRFGTVRNAEGKKVPDKSVIIYNENLALSGIPETAYEYVVNGRPALEWIIDRYQVTTAKGSGIVNNPNLYSPDPRYIIDLIKRVTYVSVETVKLISMLPEWEVLESI